jgi:hypothetical protein
MVRLLTSAATILPRVLEPTPTPLFLLFHSGEESGLAEEPGHFGLVFLAAGELEIPEARAERFQQFLAAGTCPGKGLVEECVP